MRTKLTQSFDTDDLDLYVHLDDLAKQKMRAAVYNEFRDAEYDLTYSSISSNGDSEVKVTAIAEVVDGYWILSNTDGWKYFFHEYNSFEDIAVSFLKATHQGILVRGEALVSFNRDLSGEALELEAKRKAKNLVRSSFGNFSREEYGRVIGSSPHCRVRFVVVLSYQHSAIASDIVRIQETGYMPSKDWMDFTHI